MALLPNLCVLDASCNPQLAQEAEAAGFKELAASLSHFVSLTTLRLHACGLTANALDALGGMKTSSDMSGCSSRKLTKVCPAGSSLCRLPSVRELDLSCNRSLSGGLNQLTCHLPHIKRLESLDLHLCCLEAADLEALSE